MFLLSRHRLLHARLDVALLTSLALSHETGHVAGETLDVFIFGLHSHTGLVPPLS